MRILFLILNLHILEIISSLDDGQSRVFLVVGLESCAYLSEDSLVWSVTPLQTPGELIPVRVFSSVIFTLCVWSSSRFQTATDDSQVSNLAFLKEIQDLAEDIFETMHKAKSLQKLWLKRSEASGKILKRHPCFGGLENPLCYQLLAHLGEGAPPAGQGQHCLLLGRVELDPSSLGGIKGTKEE